MNVDHGDLVPVSELDPEDLLEIYKGATDSVDQKEWPDFFSPNYELARHFCAETFFLYGRRAVAIQQKAFLKLLKKKIRTALGSRCSGARLKSIQQVSDQIGKLNEGSIYRRYK